MLLHITGFEEFAGSNGDVPSGMAHWWVENTISGFTIQDGRYSGSKALRYSTNIETSRYFETPVFVGIGNTLVCGFAFFNPGSVANDRMIVAFREGANLGMNVRLLTTNEYQVRLGTSVIATTTGEGTAGAWCFLEFKVVTHGSSGSFSLSKNGSVILSDSGIDTQPGSNAWHDVIRFHSPVSLGLIDDLYIADAGPIGDRRVVTLFPDAAGSDADFTPTGAGTNHECVDEHPADDSTYVESATTDHQDLHGIPTPSDIGAIEGIMHTVVCKKSDVTNFDVKLVTKSDDTESVSSAQTVDSTSYAAKRRILEDDPDTAAPWTASGIGAAEFGYRVG